MTKDCILYLTKDTPEDNQLLDKSLTALYKYYLKKYPTDVIIFCERTNLCKDWNLNESFTTNMDQFDIIRQTIDFHIPDYPKEILDQIPEYYPHPDKDTIGHSAYGSKGFTLGYRHMCRFFSGDIYNHPILQNYDYYLRLDTDSFILKPINYNIFDYAREYNYYYGYIKDAVQFDHPKVVEGLWNYCRMKYGDKVITPERQMFYTNFELGKMSWFLDKEYQEFYNHIDSSGGIYINRWGDAPIKKIGIDMLMDKKHQWPVADIAYQHGACYNV